MSSPQARKLITRKFFGPGLPLDISRHHRLGPALREAVQAVCTEYHWADVWQEMENRSVLIFSPEEVVERSLATDLKPLRQADAGHLFHIAI